MEPSTLKTTEMQMVQVNTQKEDLYALNTWKEVVEAAQKMKHGEIVAMANYCDSQGVRMPHKFVFWMRFNAGGKCCICGSNTGNRWPGPIYDNNKEINAGGYCNTDGVKVHKSNMWHMAEVIDWQRITRHPTQKRTWYRHIYWTFFWFLPFGQEEFCDPDTKIIYRRKDRKSTRDDGPLSDAEHIKYLSAMIYRLADQMVGKKS